MPMVLVLLALDGSTFVYRKLLTSAFEYENYRYGIAEVVGSNPITRSIFINLVNYGIKLSTFLIIVGQIQQQSQNAPKVTSVRLLLC